MTFHELLVAVQRHLGGRGLLFGVALLVVSAALSLAVATAVLVSWPADRFVAEAPRPSSSRWHWLGRIGRTLGGGLLIAVGLVLSVPGVPGQGLLTILIGLSLLDFPGKQRLELRLLSRPAVRSAVNGLRQRFGRPPLALPPPPP